MDPKIIVGFHGIGKTYAAQNLNLKYSIFDFFYTEFENKQDVLNGIIYSSTIYDYVLIDNNDFIRELLSINDIKYYLIYPNRHLKEKYINNFKLLNYDENYINNISDNWDNELDKIEKELFPYKIELKEDIYLSDILNFSFD